MSDRLREMKHRLDRTEQARSNGLLRTNWPYSEGRFGVISGYFGVTSEQLSERRSRGKDYQQGCVRLNSMSRRVWLLTNFRIS